MKNYEAIRNKYSSTTKLAVKVYFLRKYFMTYIIKHRIRNFFFVLEHIPTRSSLCAAHGNWCMRKKKI